MSFVLCFIHNGKKLCFTWVQAGYFALVILNEDKTLRKTGLLKKAKFTFNLERTASWANFTCYI